MFASAGTSRWNPKQLAAGRLLVARRSSSVPPECRTVSSQLFFQQILQTCANGFTPGRVVELASARNSAASLPSIYGTAIGI